MDHGGPHRGTGGHDGRRQDLRGEAAGGASGSALQDADHEIEEAAGLTVAEIFEKFGEPEFRDGERRVIARLLGDAPHMLATGGGAYMDSATRAAMKEKAFTIWPRRRRSNCCWRGYQARHPPPAQQCRSQGTLERLLAQREPAYAEADYVLESVDGPHEKAVEQVLDILKAAGLLLQEAAP